MKRLTGKVAIVTGASKGIGASIAEHLAKEGASVIVNYASSQTGADATVKRITQAGGKAFAIQAEVQKSDDLERLFQQTIKQFGQLDILVNNAGVYEFKPLEEITPEHFHRQFDINVLGMIIACQKAAQLMEKNGGSIINIGSVISRSPVPGGAVYAATKGAVDVLTKALAQELGPKKIRVNAINPGMVETEGFIATGVGESEWRKQIEAATPLGRIAQPEDIGKAAVFFASHESGWATGELLNLSGGKL